MTLRTTYTAFLLFPVMLLLPFLVSAESLELEARAQPLPPPPGPYVSSRPQLEPYTNNNRMPTFNNMQQVPMRYIPDPRQMQTVPPWWRGPVGR